MNKPPLFVTGIGTNIGKTIVSAVLVQHLQADYWKPVQAGDLHYTDSDQIRLLVSNEKTVVHPEQFLLKLAASPHKAARQEGVSISITDFILPQTANQLVIEGAGGLYVPLSDTLYIINLIEHFKAEAVLVVRNYLGCINHTLLSLHALKSREIPLKYVVFNGDFDEDTLNIILDNLPPKTTSFAVTEFQAIDRTAIINAMH